MMERKRYLELCQRNAVCQPKIKVSRKGMMFYPTKLIIWFDADGNARNTGFLTSVSGNSALEANIEELEEVL